MYLHNFVQVVVTILLESETYLIENYLHCKAGTMGRYYYCRAGTIVVG